MPRRSKTVAASGVYLTPEVEQELVNRLARIEGHVRGVRAMLLEHRDCDDILTQVAGVKAAVNQVAIRLLEGHLDTCVAQTLRSGDSAVLTRHFRNSLARVLK